MINEDEFNRMVTAILLKYMEFNDVPPSERMERLTKFNNYLNTKIEKNESIQLSEDDKIES
jgi:hypothetical protein